VGIAFEGVCDLNSVLITDLPWFVAVSLGLCRLLFISKRGKLNTISWITFVEIGDNLGKGQFNASFNHLNFLQYKPFYSTLSSFEAIFLSKTLPKIYKTFFIKLLF